MQTILLAVERLFLGKNLLLADLPQQVASRLAGIVCSAVALATVEDRLSASTFLRETNQVADNPGELSQKRILVGCISLVCIAIGLALYLYPGNDGLQGALLRVGMLLGAFWLAMPTKKRPAAWKVLQSNWALPGAIVAAILMPRFKAMFPVFAVLAGIAYFARPKSARK